MRSRLIMEVISTHEPPTWDSPPYTNSGVSGFGFRVVIGATLIPKKDSQYKGEHPNLQP